MSSPGPAAGSQKDVVARIAYWGVEGAGKSASLQAIHRRLKPTKRGDLSLIPTRLDPTITFEELPIELGSMNGQRTELRLLGLPGGAGLEATRKQLLDRVDGVVLVLDCQADRLQENLASVAELRESLSAYGTRLESIPVVVQYNKRDLGDPYTIEELHRRIALPGAAVFETVASEGKGILETLTTISKRIVRMLRERNLEPEPVVARPAPQPTPAAPAAPSMQAPAPAPPSSPSQVMEAAILADGDAPDDPMIQETRVVLDQPWSQVEASAKQDAGMRLGRDLRIVSVGTAQRTGERSIAVPIVLGNGDGETMSVSLGISLDPLLDGDASTPQLARPPGGSIG